MDSTRELHIILGKGLYGSKGGPGALKNIKKQTDTLLNLFVWVNNGFAIVVVDKPGR